MSSMFLYHQCWLQLEITEPSSKLLENTDMYLPPT